MASREAEARCEKEGGGGAEKGAGVYWVSTMCQAYHSDVTEILVTPELATLSSHQKRRFYQPLSTWFPARIKPHCNDLTSVHPGQSWLCSILGRTEKAVAPISFCVYGSAEELWLRKATTHLLLQPHDHPVREDYLAGR